MTSDEIDIRLSLSELYLVWRDGYVASATHGEDPSPQLEAQISRAWGQAVPRITIKLAKKREAEK